MSLFEPSRTKCCVCTLMITSYVSNENINIYQEDYLYQCGVLSGKFNTLNEIKVAIADYLQKKAINYLNISEKIREEIK